MRELLTHNVLIPTERAMRRRGWQQVAGATAEEVLWRVPQGREVLQRTGIFPADARFGQLHGKLGLPAGDPVWRHADGSVFSACPETQPTRYKLRTELSMGEMRQGTTNGVLTPGESRLVNRLTAVEQELQQLSHLESRLARGSVMRMPDLQPHASVSGTLLGELPAIGRHNTALASARNEIAAT